MTGQAPNYTYSVTQSSLLYLDLYICIYIYTFPQTPIFPFFLAYLSLMYLTTPGFSLHCLRRRIRLYMGYGKCLEPIKPTDIY
jgi:hypothetical protein